MVKNSTVRHQIMNCYDTWCSTLVTYGYALQQCVRESVLGGLVAISAVIGIIGSVTFPFLRKKLNVTRYTNQY